MNNNGWPGRLKGIGVLLVAAVALAACSGGDDSEQAAGSSSDAEKAVLDYVACLRDQGMDVPDPKVDDSGNLVLYPGSDGQEPTQSELDEFEEKYEAAQEVCGSPPQGAVGGFDHGGDSTEFQDAMVAFAQCMRENGVDIADPDFSSPAGQGEFFQDFHRIQNDPAFDRCQQDAFGSLGGGGG